jgi:uncharacterized protein YbjT (DUF2867 family)
MRILVIGATGLLGKEIAKLLSHDPVRCATQAVKPGGSITLSPQLRRPPR